MYQFFKSMHSISDLNPKNYNSIKELVIDIANSAGYHTELVRVGEKDVIKTKYYNKWDDTLVAKWYCYYEVAFKKVFIKHPEFRNDFIDFILTRVFNSFFSALKLDKITCDAGVNSLFNLTLSNRIGEVIFLIGSPVKLAAEIKTKEDNDKFLAETGSKVRYSKRKCQKNVAINYNTLSLNELFDPTNDKRTVKYKEPSMFDFINDDVIVDLKRILKNNEYGEIVLEALLYSNKKININKLLNFIDIKKDERTSYTLDKIRSAYMAIVDYMYNLLEEDSILKNELNKQYTFMQRPSFLKKFSYGDELLVK